MVMSSALQVCTGRAQADLICASHAHQGSESSCQVLGLAHALAEAWLNGHDMM